MPRPDGINKVNMGRASKILSFFAVGLVIIGFGLYAASGRNTKDTHAAPLNAYTTQCPGPNYPTLQLGSANNCVYYLQQIFHDSGFAVPVTGKFDSTTNSAVVFFQYNAKLPANGVVDSATWGALGKYGKSSPTTPTSTTTTTPTTSTSTSTSTTTPSTSATNPYASLCAAPRPTLEFTATGNCVKFLQQLMHNSGFSIAVTGSFDKSTLAGVVFYQANKRFPATGVVNGQTWGALTGDGRITNQVLGVAVPPNIPNNPYFAACPAPRPVLQEGATGNCVKFLQQIFKDNGFGSHVTGTFDAITRSSVVYYQANKKLTANGVVSGSTWGGLTGDNRVTSQVLGTGLPAYLVNNPYEALCQAPRPVLQEGATGNCVKFLQQIFKSSGFGITVDGIFGPATKSAVSYYQAVKKLPNTGVVNGATWYALTYDSRISGQTLGTGTWQEPVSTANPGAGASGTTTSGSNSSSNDGCNSSCQLYQFLAAVQWAKSLSSGPTQPACDNTCQLYNFLGAVAGLGQALNTGPSTVSSQDSIYSLASNPDFRSSFSYGAPVLCGTLQYQHQVNPDANRTDPPCTPNGLAPGL